jgi:hypothetical protein
VFCHPQNGRRVAELSANDAVELLEEGIAGTSSDEHLVAGQADVDAGEGMLQAISQIIREGRLGDCGIDRDLQPRQIDGARRA